MQSPTTQTESTLHVRTPTLNINAPPFPPNLHQAPLPPHANRPNNFHTNQHTHTPSHTFNTQLPPPFNPHVPPPYFPQYPATTSPSVHSSDSSIVLALQKQWERQEKLDMECNQMEKEKEERKRMKEEREQRKEDRKQIEKRENQQRSRINKAFEKIPSFDGTNPSYCFDWLEQTEALVNEHHGWIYREELLLNCGTSMSKTIHTLPQGVTNQCIKDAVLRNHSNLRTVSQRSNAYQQLHQKPDEALQSYNTRYASFFHLAYPELELDNPLSRMHCIHYSSSLYGKPGDEMTGRPRVILMHHPPSSSKTHDINNEFLGTNNFFVPDGSNRRIHQIQNKVFHAGYLDNGNNAYLLELPALENMLNTRKFLMDEMSGQFYAVYGNSYQRMSTKPMLQQAWATGELIDELSATRKAFGYTGLAGSTPPLTMGNQPTASTSQQPDDLLPRQPAPKTVQYQPPNFRLTRPTTHLTKNERIQVHHNYILAVSSLEHKKDFINRLKRSDTCNIPAYEAEMSRHMTLHEDVIERVLNILKQDDYYRTLEDLPVIDELTAYDDIKLFPELYDMSTIIERVTAEADLIERQLKRPGMYPQHTDLSQNTPNLPKTNPQPASSNNSRNSSPQSSLPCGQRTPAASTSSSDAPSTPNINPSSQSFTTGEDHNVYQNLQMAHE